jgi:outer membrane protein OmpA-like peptidoglycan-associated protein
MAALSVSEFSMRIVLLGFVLLLAACADRAAPPAAIGPLAPTYSVFFEPDQTTLSKEAKGVVAEVASKIRATSPSTILVEGFASKPGVPVKNQQISRQRVETVVKALADAGVSSADMLKIAKGEKTSGLDPTGTTGDRRVEITLQFAR